MFVRAPKHFKSGKQHIYNFSGNFRVTQLHENLPTNLFLQGDSSNLYGLVSQFSPVFSPDTQLSRVTVKYDIYIDFSPEQDTNFIGFDDSHKAAKSAVDLFSYIQRINAMGLYHFNIIADWFIEHKKAIIANYHANRYPLEDIEGFYPLETEDYYAEYVLDSFQFLTLRDFKKLIYWFRNKKQFLVKQAAADRREVDFYKYLDEENGGKVNKIIVKTKDPYKRDEYISSLARRVKQLQELERRETIRQSVFANEIREDVETKDFDDDSDADHF